MYLPKIDIFFKKLLKINNLADKMSKWEVIVSFYVNWNPLMTDRSTEYLKNYNNQYLHFNGYSNSKLT